MTTKTSSMPTKDFGSRRWLILFFFFISGASGLTYEVLWVRQLSLIFGATALAVSTVLSAYMAGLALGSYVIGRLVDRLSISPLKIYLLLEAGIACLALVIPHCFDLVLFFYPDFKALAGTSFWLFSLIRFVLLFSLLLLPTFLMGGTLPVIGRLFVQQEDQLGTDMGMIYGWNTLGATLGCFAAGFWLINLLGVANTNYLAISLNLIAAVGMFLSLKDLLDVQGCSALKPARTKKWRLPEREQTIVLIAICLSGFTALVYEVVWTRLLTLILGASTYAFTTMLTVFLAGIGLGSFFGGKMVDRSKDPVTGLAILEILIGIFGVILVAGFGYLPDLFLKIYLNFSHSWTSLSLLKLLFAAIFMLFPTFCFGMTFPYAVRLYFKDSSELGMDVGMVYSVNTIGSILGSLAAGFLALPLLGSQLTSNLNAALNLLIGIVLLLSWQGLWQNKSRIALFLLALILIPAQFLLPDWKKETLVSGTLFSLKQSLLQKNGQAPKGQVLFFEEDVTATVSVLGYMDGPRNLQINGKTVASTNYKDIRLQQMLGHLPMLIAHDPQEVLVIGFGTGMTAGATTLYPMRQVTVAEISAAVPRATRMFDKENYAVTQNPQVNVVIDDGRNFLLGTDKKFDVITSDPIHPWTAGASSLYSKEHYELCKKHLEPGGVMCQWVPLYELSNEDYFMILKTFAKTFENSSLWFTGTDSFLIGTMSPMKIDWETLGKKLAIPGVNADLQKINLEDINELLSCYVTNQDGLLKASEEYLVNSDNYPYLEFSAPKSMYKRTVSQNLAKLIPVRSDLTPYLVNASTTEVHLYQRHYQAKLYDLEAEYYAEANQKAQEIEAYEKIIRLLPDNRHSRQILSGYYLEKAAYFFQQKKYPEAIEFYQKLTKIEADKAGNYLSLGYAYLAQQYYDDAIANFVKAVELEPANSDAMYILGLVYEKTGRLEKATIQWKKLLVLPNSDLSKDKLMSVKSKLSRLNQ